MDKEHNTETQEQEIEVLQSPETKEEETSTPLNQDSSANFDEPKKEPKTLEIITKSTAFSYFLNAMVVFGVCFICCWFVFYVLLVRVDVIGFSMLPTINSAAYNEKEHIDNVYMIRSSNFKYKDIVIIKEGKTTSNERLIKRVIATPGQTITFIKTSSSVANERIVYDIYLDGEKLVEDYIYDQTLFLHTSIASMSFYTYYQQLISALATKGNFTDTMEANEYFVMGDNRNNSTDSRFFGPVKNTEIIGKVVIHVKYGQSLFNAIWSSLFGLKLCY